MTTPAPWWAWARDGSMMHAWPLTEQQVQAAKADGSAHDTVCGHAVRIGERPVRRPHADARLNHCPDCWAILNPRSTSPFLSALVLPAIPHTDTRWKRSS
jgi:hypothetical protein